MLRPFWPRAARSRPRPAPARGPSFRPQVERLDDRVAPAATLLTDLVTATPDSLVDNNVGTGSHNVRVDIVPLGGAGYFLADNGPADVPDAPAVGLWKTDGTAAGTTLVKAVSRFDYHTRELTASGGRLFFTARDTTSGFRELWTSDGTEAGTHVAREIGVADIGNPNVRQLTDVGGTIYFIADTVPGRELWKSDGTKNGTEPVALISEFFSSLSVQMAGAGGALFFSKFDIEHGTELWKTDGTAAGTVLVTDIRPGSAGSGPNSLTAVGDRLFFLANDGTNEQALWVSDGTAAGTVLVKDIRASGPGAGISRMTASGNKLYFVGNDGTTGNELWVSDGTAAGTVGLDLTPGAGGSDPAPLKGVGGEMYFFADQAPTPGLYRTDGTPTGTTHLAPVLRPVGLIPGDFPRAEAAVVGGDLYFSANGPGIGTELWKTDGTAAGTALVRDIEPGAGSSLPGGLANVNGALVFAATTLQTGREPWRSDGTAAGTALVRDVNDYTVGSNSAQFTPSGGRLFFTTHRPANASDNLWVSDGAAGGTVRLTEFPARSLILSPTDLNGTLYFTAIVRFNVFDFAYQVWKSDGTAAGTVKLDSFLNNGIGRLTAFNGALYFPVGPDGGLFRSDGTPGGAKYLSVNGADYLTVFNGALYFTARNNATGAELWKTDGTAAGTVFVKDIRPGSAGSDPAGLMVANGSLYFTADDGAGGRELWKSDGSPAGTVPVKDVNPGTGSSNPARLTAVGGALYFTADDGLHGIELWRTDGTPAGTRLVEDITAGPGGSDVRALNDVNGTLFFWANGAVWRSGGTAAGTYPVKPMADIGETAVLGGRLFFAGVGDTGGFELWTTDGSATVRAADVWPGAVSSSPGSFSVIDGKLYFAADDGDHGREPWVLDPAGLFQTARIAVSRSAVNLATNGAIAVTLFGSAGFDVTQVVPGSVDFAGAFAFQSSLQDVDGDGRPDLVLHFRIQDTLLRGLYERLLAEDANGDGVLDSTSQVARVSLAGALAGGSLFEGSDLLDLSLSGKQLRDLLDQLFGG